MSADPLLDVARAIAGRLKTIEAQLGTVEAMLAKLSTQVDERVKAAEGGTGS